MKYKLDKLSPFTFGLIIIKYFRVSLIFISLCSVITIGLGLIYQDFQLIKYTMYSFSLFICGIVSPTYVHEYMHIIGLRKTEVQFIEIQTTWLRFSLKITNLEISNKNRILIALLGPLSCFCIAFLFYTLSLFFLKSFFIKSLAILYGFHIINLLPIFGDGKTIFKILIKKLKE